MPLKKAVGAERRMDLASFFCMIGRHGPAVALAVVAVVTVLAGFYIYRTVRGRRRKAACDDGAASPGEEDRDASVTQQSPHRSGEATDVNSVMEDVGNLRRRAAAAAEEKPPTAAPQTQTPGNQPAAVFRAAPEEVQQSPAGGNGEVWSELLEDKRPEDGDVSGNTGREEEVNTSQIPGKTGGDCQSVLERMSDDAEDGPASLSPDQLVEVEVLSAQTGFRHESQPEEEKEGKGPVDEEEELSRDSSHEEHKRSDASVPAAEASDAGSSPERRQKDDEASQRVEDNCEALIHGPAEGTPGELRSAPDGASPPSDNVPPVCDLQLSSSEQMQKKKKKKDDDDAAASSAGVGAESGISSLAVSPDVDADGKTFPVSSGSSVEQLTEVTFQMFHSESVRWTHQQSSAANEDTFGHQIEDSYHSYYDRFAAQISVGEQPAAGVDLRTSITSVEVVERTEKTSISVKKTEDAETERTEISIMEATMDTNEWITDGNAPLLPWMQTSQAAPAELHQAGTLLADESLEHFKKVVAVQPMPQNVNVTFRVHYHTRSPYQTLAVTGDHPELGNWEEFVPLEKVEEGHWSTVVSLPTESHVEWKFLLLDKGEVCRWEECRNRLLDTGLGDDVVVHKWWGLA